MKILTRHTTSTGVTKAQTRLFVKETQQLQKNNNNNNNKKQIKQTTKTKLSVLITIKGPNKIYRYFSMREDHNLRIKELTNVELTNICVESF